MKLMSCWSSLEWTSPCQGEDRRFKSGTGRMTEEVRSMPLSPCFKCGKTLEPVDDMIPDQPYAGTLFVAHGHYGSTAWDPPATSSRYLEVILCDECLRVHADRVQEVQPHYVERQVDRIPWDPDSENN